MLYDIAISFCLCVKCSVFVAPIVDYILQYYDKYYSDESSIQLSQKTPRHPSPVVRWLTISSPSLSSSWVIGFVSWHPHQRDEPDGPFELAPACVPLNSITRTIELTCSRTWAKPKSPNLKWPCIMESISYNKSISSTIAIELVAHGSLMKIFNYYLSIKLVE